jgi:hypothetical protein
MASRAYVIRLRKRSLLTRRLLAMDFFFFLQNPWARMLAAHRSTAQHLSLKSSLQFHRVPRSSQAILYHRSCCSRKVCDNV